VILSGLYSSVRPATCRPVVPDTVAQRAFGPQFEPNFDQDMCKSFFITKAILCRPIPSLVLRLLVLFQVAARYREQFLQQFLQQIFLKDRIHNNHVFLDGTGTSSRSSWLAKARSFRASRSEYMLPRLRQSRRGCYTSVAIFEAVSSRSPICVTIAASAS
jgi:hypothetical protein